MIAPVFYCPSAQAPLHFKNNTSVLLQEGIAFHVFAYSLKVGQIVYALLKILVFHAGTKSYLQNFIFSFEFILYEK